MYQYTKMIIKLYLSHSLSTKYQIRCQCLTPLHIINTLYYFTYNLYLSPLPAICIYDQYNLPIRIELLWSVNLFSNLDDDDRLSAVFVSKFS